MYIERQTTYGWPIAIDLFLGGAGAGAFIGALALRCLAMQQSLARIVFLLSPLLVLLGALFLLADITIRTRFYRIFTSIKSWTSRGAWILTIFIISALTYTVISSHYLPFLQQFDTPAVRLFIGIIAALFSLLVMIYPGFLMGTIQAIPFWNTPLLPLLFLLSGLSNGVACVIVIAPLFLTTPAPLVEVLRGFGSALIILTLLQAAALYAFLKSASRENAASRESLRLLETSHCTRKMGIFGVVVPIALSLWGIFADEIQIISLLSIISAAVLSLGGGLYLRYAIVHAGVFLPRFTIDSVPNPPRKGGLQEIGGL